MWFNLCELTLNRFDPGDGPLRLSNLHGVFQPPGSQLKTKIEEFLSELLHLLRQLRPRELP
jgi:hypothetical protein